jgi:hypothetical protein
MKFYISILFLFSSFLVFAQTSNSPYTNNGLGEQASEGMITNNAMGGVGLANPSFMHINSVNPALLTYNKITAFNLGFGSVYNSLRGNGITQNNFTGNLQYLAFAFPISKKYTASLGMQPFTTVNYNYSSIQLIENSDDLVRYTKKGDGGITSIYLSQGFRVSRNFSIGLKASYLFGAIDSYTRSSVVYSNEYEVEKNLAVNYKGFILKPGISYQIPLKKDFSLNLGATYQLPTRLSKHETLISQKIGADNALVYSDTISSEAAGNVVYPGALGFGVGLEKAKKWTVGIDFNYQDWSSFKENEHGQTKDSYSIGIGGELFPNFASENFFKRMGFQGGFNYAKTRLFYNSKQLNDFSFSFGTSIPVSGLSLVNLSLSAGTRGTTSSNLYKETYVKFSLGVSLNDRNWFVRKKYD